MIGPTSAGKATAMLAMLDEALATHSHVVVISKHGSAVLPGKVVQGQVVTDSGEIEGGSVDTD